MAFSGEAKKIAKMEEWYMVDDLLMKILSWLPKKSRCRFKCVCKRWSSLIPEVKIKEPDTALFCLGISRTSCRQAFHQFKNNTMTPIGPSFVHDDRLTSLQSCNGLLLCRGSGQQHYVWNPFEDHLVEAIPRHPKQDLVQCQFIGLVFGGHNPFYQVVTLLKGADENWTLATLTSRTRRWRQRPAVLRLAADVWKHSRPPTVYSRGALYWLLRGSACMVIFHVRSERFEIINNLKSAAYINKMWEWEGQVRGLATCPSPCVEDHATTIWVWAFSEETRAWQMQQKIVIHVQQVPATVCQTWVSFVPRPLHLIDDDGVLYLGMKDGSVCSFDLEKRRMEVCNFSTDIDYVWEEVYLYKFSQLRCVLGSAAKRMNS